MKVINKTVSDNETSVEIELFDKGLPLKVRKRIQEDVGNYLVEQTLIAMNEQKSPIAGEGGFKALSPLYKKRKLDEVGSGSPNLEFDGVMKDELNFFATDTGIEIGVYGERAGAADGHNNLSGKSKLPTRRFLPDEGQKYKKTFEVEVERIIADAIAEESTFTKSQFKGIETKSELYAQLKTIFGEMSRSELQLAVYRSDDLTQPLKSLDLLDLL